MIEAYDVELPDGSTMTVTPTATGAAFVGRTVAGAEVWAQGFSYSGDGLLRSRLQACERTMLEDPAAFDRGALWDPRTGVARE